VKNEGCVCVCVKMGGGSPNVLSRRYCCKALYDPLTYMATLIMADTKVSVIIYKFYACKCINELLQQLRTFLPWES